VYFDELKRAMEWLAKKPDTIFLGQAVAAPGTAMSNTLVDIPAERLLEFPVAEEMQMGQSIGLAFDGYVSVSIFPRWNFLLLAMNQLVNHLDKMPEITSDRIRPRVIIRTSVGSERPLFPQHQHIGDYSDALKLMLDHVHVVRLEEADQILPEYQKAYDRDDGRSTILVEYGDYYNEK